MKNNEEEFDAIEFSTDEEIESVCKRYECNSGKKYTEDELDAIIGWIEETRFNQALLDMVTSNLLDIVPNPEYDGYADDWESDPFLFVMSEQCKLEYGISDDGLEVNEISSLLDFKFGEKSD